MVDPTIREEIKQQLDLMPLDLQRRVLDFARALAQCRPKGEAGRDLLRFAGMLDSETARAMKEAIESGCEHVDRNEW